jgi:hypothetical protein
MTKSTRELKLKQSKKQRIMHASQSKELLEVTFRENLSASRRRMNPLQRLTVEEELTIKMTLKNSTSK